MKVVSLHIVLGSNTVSGQLYAGWLHRIGGMNKFHRDNDQPAVIFSDGYREWWKDGQYVGSAVISKVTY